MSRQGPGHTNQAGTPLNARLQRRLSDDFMLDATLALTPGITILFGASGSGKTTLLRCLSGLATPDAGAITLGDRVLFDAAGGISVAVQDRRIGYLVQQLALFPHLTNDANVLFGLDGLPAADARARVSAIAESFGIAGLLRRRPAEISGGERQRVALARTLVREPALLLLDEPLSALDHATQGRIIADLRRWNEARRIPILYVTHAHREVFALGERVLALEQGRIVADGTPHSVLNAPAREAVAQAAGFENVLDASVLAMRPDLGTMECRLAGAAVHVEVPRFEAAVGDAVRLAIRAGDILIAVEPPRGLSARNLLPATIVSVSDQGGAVIIRADAGVSFDVQVTVGAVRELGLTAGTAVWLVIKTHSFHRVARSPGNISS